MQAPFEIGAHALLVTTSIGVAFLQQGSHADDVIKRADQAMYSAKRGGRNRFEVARQTVGCRLVANMARGKNHVLLGEVFNLT